MKYVNLGQAGLRVSRICLGMMSFGNDSDRPWVLGEAAAAAAPIVKAAAEGGITFFDIAGVYSGGSIWSTSTGTSSMFACQFAKARHAAGDRGMIRFVSMQNHYNLIYREEEREMIPQVALSWLLHKPGLTAPIIGAAKSGHLDDALAAVELPLAEDGIKRLEDPQVPHPVLGPG